MAKKMESQEETLESSVEENKVFILQHNICNSHDPLHIVPTVFLST